MAATAANALVVSASTTSGGTYDVISGLKDASRDAVLAALNVTAFSDGIDETFIYGLRNVTLSFSGTYQPTDTGYAKVKAAFEASPPTNLFVKYLFDGTSGWRAEFLITKCAISGTVDGTNDVSIELQQTGATTVV